MIFVSCAQGPAPIVYPDIWRYRDAHIGDRISTLSVEELAGRLLLIGLEDQRTGAPLESVDEEHRAWLRRIQPGGVILYGGSFRSLTQINTLVRDVGMILHERPFVGVDYEGGLVSRLTDTGGVPATPIPTARRIGEAFAQGRLDLAQLEQIGSVMGAELRAVGANMNFAPVADIDPVGSVGAIGRHGRVFSDEPGPAGDVAAALTRGMQGRGVAAVVKHFPGHGTVTEDSHETLPELLLDAKLIYARDIHAFERTFAAEPVGIMTAHLSVPALDPSRTPATLSHPILTGVLREELGYDGLIITDALNMRAITDVAEQGELAVRAVEAGVDMLLKPVDPERARDAIVNAVAEGRLTRERLEESVTRIFLAKLRLGVISAFPDTRQWPIGTDEHAQIVQLIDGDP